MRIVNPNNRVFILNYNSVANGQLFSYDCNYQYVTTNIFPWVSESSGVSSFSDVLYNVLNTYLNSQNILLSDCLSNSLNSFWSVEIKINGVVLVTLPFFSGVGTTQVPNNSQWRSTVNLALSQLLGFSYYYFFVGNVVTIYNLLCPPTQNLVAVDINVGINFIIECN
jgi:hypothetical protein